MTTQKTVKLIMVTEANNNKFYHMFDLGNGTFKVEYGRVEKTKVEESYSISMWEKKYKEKLKKGYQDVTHLFAEVQVPTSTGAVQSFSDITNSQVKQLIDTLQAYAKKTIQKNYTVKVEAVTEAQVNTAQDILNQIAGLVKKGTRAFQINPLLLKLYTIIPREMKNVKSHLFNDIETDYELRNAQQKLDQEQSTLDTMAGQVALLKAQREAEVKSTDPKAVAKTMTMLDAMGLEIEEVSTKEVDMIKKMMGSNANQFKKAFRVTNKKTEIAFQNRLKSSTDKTTELFWHGSRNENWFNILETGLLIRPSGAVHTGSMFGDGIYGANKAQKSVGYTSLKGSYWTSGSDNKAYIALFDFHVGKQKHIRRHDSSCYSLNDSKLKAEGFDSVYAHGGADLRNDEFIVYNSSAVTVRYIIEIG
jgi:poly [ADP-ribose] polymerase 2/3/4